MAKVSKKIFILDVATKHFSNYGYELTSLENIAKECEVTKPAIYYHFKDKASLYEAVLIKEFQLLSQQIKEALKPDDALERLKSYISIFGKFLIENPNISAIFARELADGGKNISTKALQTLSTTIKTLDTILKDGCKSSELVCENPFMIQLMIISTLTNYTTTKNLRSRVAQIIGTKPQEDEFKDIVERLSLKIVKGLQ